MKKEFLDMTETERNEWHCDYLHRQLIKTVKEIHKRETYKELKHIKDTLIENHDSCEICGYSYKPILQAHHILPVKNGGDNAADNLICVCPNCHKTIHAAYKYFGTDTSKSEELFLFVLRKHGKNACDALLDVITRYSEKTVEKARAEWGKTQSEHF